MTVVVDLWASTSGLSGPSQRVIAWACGPFSATSRGVPSAICSLANESSMDSCSAGPLSGSQYARLSPTHAAMISSSDATAATNVHEGGLTVSPRSVATRSAAASPASADCLSWSDQYSTRAAGDGEM